MDALFELITFPPMVTLFVGFGLIAVFGGGLIWLACKLS